MSSSGTAENEDDRDLTEEELAELEKASLSPMSALLKKSLVNVEDELPAPAEEAKLLESVQTKLRKRSRGKFYGDGWSTSQSKISYVLVAAVMLVTIVAVYLALGPTGFSLR